MPKKPRPNPWAIPGESHTPGDLIGLLARISSHVLVQPSRKLGGAAALDYTWVPGYGRMVLVLGENGSGKSVLRRLLHLECGWSFLSLSMEQRGHSRALVDYGMESGESTGMVSGRALRRVLRSSHGRARPHVVFLDEPDVGMSDALAAGAGEELASWEVTSSPHCYGVFITSHNRRLIAALVRATGAPPHVLWFGPPGFDLGAWLEADPPARSLDEALTHARQTETRIRRALKAVR